MTCAALTDEMQDTDAVKAALAALNVAEEARASAENLGDLEAQTAASRMTTLYDLAIAQFGSGNGEAAIESLLKSMAVDRSWNDDAARQNCWKSLPLLVRPQLRLFQDGVNFLRCCFLKRGKRKDRNRDEAQRP